MAPPPRPSTTPEADKRDGIGGLLSLGNLYYGHFSFPLLTFLPCGLGVGRVGCGSSWDFPSVG